MQVIFAGAAAVATLTLFSAARPSDTQTVAASGSVRLEAASVAGDRVIAVDDNTNPSDGDIFTQNAQDQSTA